MQASNKDERPVKSTRGRTQEECHQHGGGQAWGAPDVALQRAWYHRGVNTKITNHWNALYSNQRIPSGLSESNGLYRVITISKNNITRTTKITTTTMSQLPIAFHCKISRVIHFSWNFIGNRRFLTQIIYFTKHYKHKLKITYKKETVKMEFNSFSTT